MFEQFTKLLNKNKLIIYSSVINNDSTILHSLHSVFFHMKETISIQDLHKLIQRLTYGISKTVVVGSMPLSQIVVI